MGSARAAEAAAEATAEVAAGDLWQRLRGRFSLPGKQRRGSRSAARWYADHPDYLDRVGHRARPFLYRIAKEVERRRMPGEIALLPIVESAFRPFAHSRGKAMGVWQFIPATARRFDLKRTWWYDGRRDIPESTRAGLDYLQKLHRKFGRDWLVALAAYNCGEGTVAKARRANRRRGRKTDFWSLKLPRETRGYVPQLLGLARVVADPRRYDVHLEPIPNRPAVAIAETGSQIDLHLAAELAGIELAELYRLNPGFNRWASDPDGPHRLVLPVDRVAGFESRLAEVPEDKRVRMKQHLVVEGDSLGRIAKAHGISVWGLKQVNRLPNDAIRPGMRLRIPVPRRDARRYAAALRESRASPVVEGRGAKQLYVVRPGDSLWEIGRSYQVSPETLAAWNGMATNDTLRPGRTLVVRPAGKGDEGAADGRKRVQYRVEKGDSLWTIARRFGVSVDQLRAWNKLPRGNLLRQGQKLVVYLEDEAEARESA